MSNEPGYFRAMTDREPVLLTCDGITVSVPGRELVSSMSIELRRGEIVAVLGRNGTGKSLSLLTMAGLRWPDTGQVRLLGEDVSEQRRQVTARHLGVHDHPGIVWDEFVGYWLTMTAAPLTWQWLLLGFCLFRVFDILKPWPIRQVDRRVGGGFGIMLDDVLAGVFAWLVLQAVILLAH